VTRKILIVGLIVLAALLPLAPPLAIFVLEAPTAVADVARSVRADAQPVAFLAITSSRAPPLR